MKAPNKIYVRPSAFTPPWPSAIDENDKYGGLEYIRKDALIEMLKGYNHPVTRIVVQELIDKINEL